MSHSWNDPAAPAKPPSFGSPWLQRWQWRDAKWYFNRCVHLRVTGREHLPPRGAFVLATNHPSQFDPPLITLAVDRWVDWLAMAELYRFRWLRAYWDALAAIPVDRSRLDPRAVATALHRLRVGRVVGLFPERRIPEPGAGVLDGTALGPGACRLALAAGVPLVPAVILGTEHLYQWHIWLFPRRAREVRVVFGEPVPPPIKTGVSRKVAADLMTRQLAATLRRLAGRTEPEKGSC